MELIDIDQNSVLHEPPTEEEIPEYNRRLIQAAYWEAVDRGITHVIIDTESLPMLATADGVKIIGSLRIPAGVHLGPILGYADGRPYTQILADLVSA